MKQITFFYFAMMFSLGGIAQEFTAAYDHTALRVSNLEQSASFYSEVLGLKEIDIPYENPILRWFSLGDPYQLHLIQMEDLQVQADIATHLALHVDDFEAFITRLNQLDIPYRDWTGSPNTIALRPDGVRQVYVQDPDGHWIEINDTKP